MPELPDLAYVESVLQPALTGKRIVAARTGDPLVLRVMVTDPFPAALVGRRVDAVTRRGHFMHFALDGAKGDAGGPLSIVINAMLVGRYRLLTVDPAQPTPRDPVALGLALRLEGDLELQYLDQKRMGKVYIARPADEAQIPVFNQLGVDLMSAEFTRELFGRLIAKRRDQVRMFLMDKRALASIGNAYADEILFAAHLHPKTFCNKLGPAEVDALYAAIPRVLKHAIAEVAARREPIETKVRDFLSVRGRDGKPCPVCGTTIRAVRIGDGDACFCPACQPAARKLFIDWNKLPGG